MIMTPLLAIENLQLAYRSGKTTRSVAGPLYFHIFRGEAFGLIGESGAGKSTLGFEILGLLGYKGGRRVSGAIKTDLRPEEIAYIPQDPSSALNPLFSVGSQLAEVEPQLSKIEKVLDEVHLSLDQMSLESYPHELSGGMKQRLVIAMALLRSPKLLVADEPTSSLDMLLQAEVMDLFREIHGRGMTFVFITHNIPLAAGFCERLAVMRNGSVVALGSPSQIFKNVQDPYLRELLGAIPVMKP